MATAHATARSASSSCHTGARNCFFSAVDRTTGRADTEREPVVPVLTLLEQTIEARRASTSDKSYTKSLLEGGSARVVGKITEEADELARAITEETDERVVAEAADLVFHLLVGLRSRDVRWEQVIEALYARMGVSGHVEKAQRSQ